MSFGDDTLDPANAEDYALRARIEKAEHAERERAETAEEALRIALNRCAALNDNLTATQRRCTELLETSRLLNRSAHVRAFHRKFGQPVNDGAPASLSEERLRFRLRLVAEEFYELLASVLVFDWPHDDLGVLLQHLVATMPLYTPPGGVMPELVDALADLEYVVTGTYVELGVDDVAVHNLVHEANMAKDARQEGGKPTKGSDWAPPDLAAELRRQGWPG